jgi:ribosomal protein L37E
MPILKVSENLKKAMEVIKIPVDSRPIDCPQCGSSAYRDGMCPSCNFINPEVMEAMQEWQQSQSVEQEAEGKKSPKKAFVEQIPDIAQQRSDCPRCLKDGIKGSMVDGACEKCGYDVPPEGLGFNSPKILGIDYDKLPVKRRGFLSPAGRKIDKAKTKLKKKKSAKEQQQVDPGAFQFDSMNAANDATTRMNQLLQTGAQIKAQTPDEEQ